ncbi:MAG: flagellar hook-basal body protein [Thermodesulfobacteriota bacterium]
MDRSIFVALSGLTTGVEKLNAGSNNLANINTIGFKKLRPTFKVVAPARQVSRAFSAPGPAVNDMSGGAMTRSGRDLDMAIEGNGFFVVKTPRGERYTRQGDFRIDDDGRLATKEGFLVLGEGGPIKLAGSGVEIDSSGAISEKGVVAGRLKIVSFKDMSLLRYEGGLYNAGKSAPGPVKGSDTKVLQGFTEGSNVSALKEMVTMMENLRAYQTQVKLIQAIDGMSRKAIEEVGRV